jgi:hypothetical protein
MQSYKFILAIVFFSTALAELSSVASARLPKRYQAWFTGPVSYLITKHECRTFAVFGRFLETRDYGDMPSYLSAVLTRGVRLERIASPLLPKVNNGGTDTPQRVASSQYERVPCRSAHDRPSEAVTRLEAFFEISQNPVTDQGAVAASL